MKKTFLIALVALSILGCAPMPKLVKVTMPFFIGSREESTSSKAVFRDATRFPTQEEADFIAYGPILTDLRDIYVSEGTPPRLELLGYALDIVVTAGEGFTTYQGNYPDNEGFFKVVLRDDMTFTCEQEVVLTWEWKEGSLQRYVYQEIKGTRDATGSYEASGITFYYTNYPETEHILANNHPQKTFFNIKCSIPEQKFAIKYKYASVEEKDPFSPIDYSLGREARDSLTAEDYILEERTGYDFRYYAEGSAYSGTGVCATEEDLLRTGDTSAQKWENF